LIDILRRNNNQCPQGLDEVIPLLDKLRKYACDKGGPTVTRRVELVVDLSMFYARYLAALKLLYVSSEEIRVGN
jgi:hypothetical protein